MKSNDLQKAQKRRYKDRRESSTTAKENDIRKERVRDNIIVETSNDDDFFTNNANSFNENAATAASHTQIVEVDDHLHHNNGSDDNYNNHASCSADSTSEGDRHSSLDVEILPSDESSSSQTFFQFDPSRMASIIKRRAMIKQLAASYHAECLSRCQKLVALQRIWEKEKEQ